MKLTIILRHVTFLFLVSLLSCQQVPVVENAKTESAKAVTTVYVVRHAEKDTLDPANKDPELSAAGRDRAETLRTLFKDQPVDAFYTTNFKRTVHTLKPTADERGLELRLYEPSEVVSLKTKVLQNHSGKTIVIAGHSNTILSIVEAFGIKRPYTEVPDSKYDHIFKITIAPDNTATLDAGQYGKATN
jgi:2,3-bisphosphoglycerate-dependent phosphoglycerate mutase